MRVHLMAILYYSILHTAKTAYHYGHNDARFAIALLRYAIGFAEEAGAEKVTRNDIDKALGHLERYNIIQTVIGSPRPTLAILYIFYS
jgi:Cdc6-like AAA superfamily ATPase